MATRRNFLKGIVASFLGTYATGTKIAFPKMDQELQIVSDVYKPRWKSELFRELESSTGLYKIDMEAEFGMPPSFSQQVDVYLAPLGIEDEANCLFVGCILGDGECTHFTKRWLTIPFNEPFRIIAIGDSLKKAVVDLSLVNVG